MDQGEQSAAAQRRPRMVQYGEPQPPRRCPRCESGNTKFCYFNNYNASQPRYFCKACRRYWTHGGTLRNVPYGGGGTGRRRKRSKKTSSSESPAAAPPIEDEVEVEPSITASEAVLMPSLFIRGLGAWQDGSFDPHMLFGTINYNAPVLPTAPMQVMGMNPGMLGPPRVPQMSAGVFRPTVAPPPLAAGAAEDAGEGFWRDLVGGGWAPDLPGGRGSRPPTPPPFI